jgi:hypothetical protein
MIRRIAAGLLGALYTLDGLYMLTAGQRWYLNTAGVAATGPYNAHFVKDVGAAFVATGLALLLRSWQPRWWPAAVAGAAFPVFHALIHAGEFAHHRDDLKSVLFIAVLAGLALWAALPAAGERRA